MGETKKKGKTQRKSVRSKGERRSSQKTSGFAGQFISTIRENIKPGWSAADRKRIAEWQHSLYIEARNVE